MFFYNHIILFFTLFSYLVYFSCSKQPWIFISKQIQTNHITCPLKLSDVPVLCIQALYPKPCRRGSFQTQMYWNSVAEFSIPFGWIRKRTCLQGAELKSAGVPCSALGLQEVPGCYTQARSLQGISSPLPDRKTTQFTKENLISVLSYVS